MSTAGTRPDTVRALVERQAHERADAVYATDVDGAQTLRYADLLEATRQVAALLQAHGSQPGDTVSLVMPNGLQTLRLLLGAMAGGWAVNPVNLLAQPEQMRYVLEHSDCRVVFVSPTGPIVCTNCLPDWSARSR